MTHLSTRETGVGLTLDGGGDAVLLLAVAVAVVLVAAAVVLAAVRRRPRDGSPGDRLRLGLAVLRYDAWLDLRGGVGRRRRRELREELRANLADASARVGSREAVRRLGPLRVLAAETAGGTRPGGLPAWSRGVLSAACAFAAVLLLELLATMWWVGAAHDSGAPVVRGSLMLFPGSALEYGRLADGVAVEFHPGWLVLAAAAAAFTVASRPWLLIRRPPNPPRSCTFLRRRPASSPRSCTFLRRARWRGRAQAAQGSQERA